MSNYVVDLYDSDDQGASWQLVAEHNIEPSLPEIGDVPNGGTFTASGDGTCSGSSTRSPDSR